MEDLEIIRPKELAKLLKVHPVTLWRWQKRGVLPKRIKLGSGIVGWRRSDIEDWLHARPMVN